MSTVVLNGKVLTAGNKALYVPTPPKKGNIITMDLDGNGNKQYRILRVDGNVAKIMAMYDDLTGAWDSTDRANDTTTMGTLTVQKYENSTLDTYLNTTWYNTLTNTAKAAIVPESVVCDAWYDSDTGDPDYIGTYGSSVPGTDNYTISKYTGGTLNIGNRNVFALGIQDVIDYLNDDSVKVDTTAILCNVNIWKMFWNDETAHSRPPLWLRSGVAGDGDRVWTIYGHNGSLVNGAPNRTFLFVRPALNLDLSKVPFTIAS